MFKQVFASVFMGFNDLPRTIAKRRYKLMVARRMEDCSGAALFQGERTQYNCFFVGNLIVECFFVFVKPL